LADRDVKNRIVDTGALVALLDRADLHHGWATDCWKSLRPPLLTCEGVLAEALHLLGDLPPSITALHRFHREGILKVDFQFEAHSGNIWRLLQKYNNVPMAFADACLVRLSEIHSDCVVWTTDSDFRIYRRNERQTIPLLSP
jgi:uncharacterized protein